MNERYGYSAQRGGPRNDQSNRIDSRKLIEIRNLLDTDKVKFLKEIENFAKLKITSSQLRNLYDPLVDMNFKNNSEVEQRLLKLRIMLEYAYKRKTIKDDNFYNCMKEVIEDTIQNSRDQKIVGNFLQMFESIIAYSKEKER